MPSPNPDYPKPPMIAYPYTRAVIDLSELQLGIYDLYELSSKQPLRQFIIRDRSNTLIDTFTITPHPEEPNQSSLRHNPNMPNLLVEAIAIYMQEAYTDIDFGISPEMIQNHKNHLISLKRS